MNRRSGFTLVELLVVVTIMGILMLAVAPRISKMLEDNQVESSVNLIVATVSSAKAFATRQIDFDGAEYSGCAVIFTPSGRMRIVENRDYMIDDEGTPKDLERDLDYDGFADLPNVEYVRLPQDAMLFGVSRGGGGFGEVKLMAPPFAVRINQYGNLVAGANIGDANFVSPNSDQRSRQSQVFYDANFDGVISMNYPNASTCRMEFDRENPIGGGTYNPDDWDVRRNKSVTLDPETDIPHLPFEQIEALRAVVLVNRKDFEEAQRNDSAITLSATGFAGSLSDETKDWVMDNGISILFTHSLDVLINKPD